MCVVWLTKETFVVKKYSQNLNFAFTFYKIQIVACIQHEIIISKVVHMRRVQSQVGNDYTEKTRVKVRVVGVHELTWV